MSEIQDKDELLLESVIGEKGEAAIDDENPEDVTAPENLEETRTVTSAEEPDSVTTKETENIESQETQEELMEVGEPEAGVEKESPPAEETQTPDEETQEDEVAEKMAEEQEKETKEVQEDDPMSSEEEENSQTMSEETKSPKETASNDAKTTENLLSEENLDRESPEIWPEKIPGVKDFVQEHPSDSPVAPTWSKGLTQEDVDQMHELGAMSNSQLILEIKKLYDHAYKIGVDESKEMSRGKILQIFSHTKKK